jgi:ATP-dependent Clp protease ATP-binding subunit ClpC
MYPFERFTERAKKVLTLAQQEAERTRLSYIGTEHLLLGLLGEPDGLGARVLASMDVDADRVRAPIEAALAERPPAGAAHQVISPTARVKQVIEIAFEEARSMGHNYVGTAHLLLGVIVEGEGIAATVLADLGVTLDAARAEVERQLQAGFPGEPAPRKPRRPVPSLSRQAADVIARAHALAADAGASEVGVAHLEQAIAEWRARQQ